MIAERVVIAMDGNCNDVSAVISVIRVYISKERLVGACRSIKT